MILEKVPRKAIYQTLIFVKKILDLFEYVEISYILNKVCKLI